MSVYSLRSTSIVAIHGLNGHAYRSFTSKETGLMWLRDLLPNDLPNSRIMTFGYNANVLDNTATGTLADFRQSFLSSLSAMRNSQRERLRPVLFIAHSLGGIVLKSVR